MRRMRKIKKMIVVCAVLTFMMVSTTAMAVSVTVLGGKTSLSTTGTATATGTKIIGCTIYNKDNRLLSHNAGNYANDGSRTCYTSYFGPYTPYRVYGFAENAAGKTAERNYFF